MWFLEALEEQRSTVTKTPHPLAPQDIVCTKLAADLFQFKTNCWCIYMNNLMNNFRDEVS